MFFYVLCWRLLFVLLNMLILSEQVLAKILIMTSAYNRPEFIALQDKAFKKYIDDDYEFIVFNDATNEQHARDITETCVSLNILCIPVPQENRTKEDKNQSTRVLTWASWRHGEVVQYMMSYAIHHKGLVMLIDSDMLPIKKFSVKKYLGCHDIAGVRQDSRHSGAEYMWPGLMFFNMEKLPHKETICFLPKVKGKETLDSGSSMYVYFQKNRTIKKLFFNQDTRMLLDDNLYPEYQYFCNPIIKRPIKCSSCCAIKSKNDRECRHQETILKELGFRDEIIELILLKRVPFYSEFLLGDTFFHAVAGSGYTEMKADMLQRKNDLVLDFIDYMLADRNDKVTRK